VSTFITKNETTFAENVMVTKDTITVDIDDGRTISVPLSWFPRLSHGSSQERKNWRLIGRGEGISSNESQESFQKWLEGREST